MYLRLHNSFHVCFRQWHRGHCLALAASCSSAAVAAVATALVISCLHSKRATNSRSLARCFYTCYVTTLALWALNCASSTLNIPRRSPALIWPPSESSFCNWSNIQLRSVCSLQVWRKVASKVADPTRAVITNVSSDNVDNQWLAHHIHWVIDEMRSFHFALACWLSTWSYLIEFELFCCWTQQVSCDTKEAVADQVANTFTPTGQSW